VISVALVDDHLAVRHPLVVLLEREPELIGVAQPRKEDDTPVHPTEARAADEQPLLARKSLCTLKLAPSQTSPRSDGTGWGGSVAE
jgi:hypothetical protein